MTNEVVIDAQVQGGKPVLRGTRVTVLKVAAAEHRSSDDAVICT